jgi:hypothetical protein
MAFAKDYIDVAQRLRDMRAIYPDLTLQQVDIKFITFGGSDWVVYTAAAYRTFDDVRPGIGTAWEPIPGKTPYTKDSEVMVAETSAWGRALVAIGADTKNGIASANEVEARRAPVKAPKATPNAVMRLAELAVVAKDLDALRRHYATAESIGMDQVGLDTIKAMAATLTATNE